MKKRLLCRLLLLGALLPVAVAAGSLNEGLRELLGGGPATDEVLPVEQAFPVRAEIQPEQQRILLQWDIQPGYYLYRDKFDFRTSTADLRLGEAVVPEGSPEEDPEFGTVRILEGSQTLILPFEANAAPRDRALLEVAFQGCKRNTLCYPVARQGFDLPLGRAAAGITGTPLDPGAYRVAAWSGGPATATPDGASADTQTSIPGGASSHFFDILSSGSLWIMMLVFFGAGLLLAFTPCVLPMLPILSEIIIGEQAGGRRALLLSGTYVLSMALTYALFGLAAGLLHYNLQAALQNPWVLGSFSALFVALALAMFGVFSLQVPTVLQTRMATLGSGARAGLTKAGFMGAASALIVGPCVAPAIAGALVYISLTSEGALRGGSALFALGIGMGTPLIAAGTLGGHLLPRAGAWMERIRQSFGVLLLAVALWLLERVLPGNVTMLLWAALLIAVAICLGALEAVPAGGIRRRLPKALGIGLLVYGSTLLIGAVAGGGSLLQPLAGLRGGGTTQQQSATALKFTLVSDYPQLRAALAEAGRQGRPAMLDLYADWCIDCKRMDAVTFPAPEVRSILSGTMLLKMDMTDYNAVHRELLQNFHLVGPPAILFFDTGGRELVAHRIQGFLNAVEFSARARAALRVARQAARQTAGAPDAPEQGLGEQQPPVVSGRSG